LLRSATSTPGRVTLTVRICLHARIMIFRVVLAATCLLWTGCTIPLFEHPLESPDAATIPIQLFGVFKQVVGPEDGAHHVHVGPAGAEAPAGVFRFVSVSQPLDGETPLDTIRGYAIATRMDDHYVLQIPIFPGTDDSDSPQIDREKWDESAILGYLFARLRVEGDRIEMSAIDEHFVESAIEHGKLCGSVERREKTTSFRRHNDDGETVITTICESKTEAIQVTAGPCLLRAFVRSNIGSGLFSESITTFVRN
jgi:hypothetical protein